MQDVRAMFRWRTLDRQSAEHLVGEVEIIALGPDYHDSHVVHLFSSVRDFDAWTATTGLRDSVERLRHRISLAQRESADKPEIVERARAEEQRVRLALELLSERTGLALGSEELFRRATVDRPSGEPPLFDSAILFADIFYGGRWLPVFQACPDLRLYGFNDLASSIIALGVGALFSDILYRGRIFWLLPSPSQPIASIPFLITFNDVTSSIIMIS